MTVPAEAQAAVIERASGVRSRTGVPLAALTTFAIGGPVACLAEPDSPAELGRLLQFLSAEGIPWRILGAGSNILAADEVHPGCVIRLGRGLRYVHPCGGGVFRVGGAMALMSLSRELSEGGFAGLEFAGGIPASLGGAVRMNAGAHGAEMASVLRSLTVYEQGELHEYAAAALPFSYRHSGLSEQAIVVEATIALTPGDPRTSRELRAKHLAYRKETQPLSLPSAGSVFRNPDPHHPAGRLIEACGLKGARSGGARISELHGNWIVNEGRTAAARDVQTLIARCQTAVREQHGFELHPEVVWWPPLQS